MGIKNTVIDYFNVHGSKQYGMPKAKLEVTSFVVIMCIAEEDLDVRGRQLSVGGVLLTGKLWARRRCGC